MTRAERDAYLDVENARLYQIYQNDPSEENFNALFLLNQELVGPIAGAMRKRIMGSNLANIYFSFDDLCSEGLFGLIKAIEKHNPELGHLAHYACVWIKGAIMTYVRKIERKVGKEVFSLDQFRSDEDDRTMADKFAVDNSCSQDNIIAHMSMSEIQQNLVGALNSKQQKVWQLRSEGFKFREIAKMVGVSKTWAMQLMRQAKTCYKAIVNGEEIPPRKTKKFGIVKREGYGEIINEVKSIAVDDLVGRINSKHREMWRLIGEGLSVKTVAAKFNMSGAGVYGALKRVLNKQKQKGEIGRCDGRCNFSIGELVKADVYSRNEQVLMGVLSVKRQEAWRLSVEGLIMKEIGEMLGVSTTRISQFLAEAKIHYDAIESGEGQQLQKPLSQGVSIAKAQSIKVEDLVGVTDPKHLEMWELKAQGLSHQKIADKFEMTIAGVRSVLGMIWIRQGARALEFCKPAPTTVCRSVPTVVKNGKNHGKGRNFEIQQEAGKKYAELAKTTLTNALVVAVLSNFEKDILSLMLEEKSAAEIANVLNTEELKVSRFDVLHKIKRIKALPEIIEKGMVIAKTVMDNALVMSILDDFDKEVLAQMLSGKIILQIADNMGVIFAKVRGCYTRLNRLHLSLLAGTWTYCEGIVESEEDSQLQLPEQEEKNEERDDVVVKRNSFFEEVVKTDDYLQNEQALMEVLSAKHKEVWKLSIEGFVTREIGKIIGVSQARVSQLSVEAQVSYNAIAGGEDPQFKKMFGGVTLAEIRSVKADDLVEVVDLKHREMWRLRAEGVSLEKIGNKFEMTAGGISAILGKLWAKQGAEVVVESGRVLTPQQEIASKGYVELAKATLTNDLLVAALTDSEKSITNLMLEGKIAEEIAQELEMSRSNVNNGIRSIKNIPNLIEKNRTIAQFVLDNTRIASSLNDFDRDVLRLMSAGKLTLQIISDLDSTMGKVSGSFRKLKRIHEMMALRLASEVA